MTTTPQRQAPQQPPQASATSKLPTRRRSKVKEMIAQYQHDESLCRYKNKLCMNARARKRKGGLHTFCEMHREAANRNQRRLDLRKRILRRQLESEMLQAIHPINAVSPRSDDTEEDSSSPESPRSISDTQMDSPDSRDVVVDREDPPTSTSVPEPSSTPVALKEEDIYALRWLFAVDETARQQQRSGDVQRTFPATVKLETQWV